MKKNCFYVLLGLFLLLFVSVGYARNVQAEDITPKPRIILDIEKDTVTEDNAIVHAAFYNTSDYLNIIEKAGIIVSKDGQELARYEKEFNCQDKELAFTYDLKKDLGLTLQKDSVYRYEIYTELYIYKKISAVGEIKTLNGTDGEDTQTAAIIHMVNKYNGEVFRTRIVNGLNVGEAYTYQEPEIGDKENDSNYDCGGDFRYTRSIGKGDVLNIESLSKNISENVIVLSYDLRENIGGYNYVEAGIYDDETEKIVGSWFVRLPEVGTSYTYNPQDIFVDDYGWKKEYYMFNSKKTGNNLTAVAHAGRPSDENTIKLYYTKIDTLPTSTSVTIEHRDAATGELIKTETLENQKIGASYTYTPSKKAFSYGDYLKCTYASEDKRNVLSYEALWTNPANNVITVYYKTVKKTDFNQSGVKVNVADVTYNGRTQKPEVKVTYAGKTLKKGRDYTVAYKNNRKIGRGTVTIKAKTGSKYTGSRTVEFLIQPKATTLRGIVPKGTHKALVKLQKVKGVSGYEISYSTDRKLHKAKTKSTTKTSLVLKKLQAGRTYYFRVRSYKKVKDEKIYSAYSKAVKLEMKR